MPRTEVIERTVYQFSELSDQAKEAARDEYRRGGHLHHEWWDSIYEDAERVATCLGITFDQHPGGKNRRSGPKIYFSGFSSQGDGASWEGRYVAKLDAVKAITEYAPRDKELLRIAQGLVIIQTTRRLSGEGYLEARVTASSPYCHSNTMQVEVADANTCDLVDNDDLVRLLRDFADWIYKQLGAEDEYLNSGAYIDEQLADDEFDEDGRVI